VISVIELFAIVMMIFFLHLKFGDDNNEVYLNSKTFIVCLP